MTSRGTFTWEACQLQILEVAHYYDMEVYCCSFARSDSWYLLSDKLEVPLPQRMHGSRKKLITTFPWIIRNWQ